MFNTNVLYHLTHDLNLFMCSSSKVGHPHGAVHLSPWRLPPSPSPLLPLFGNRDSKALLVSGPVRGCLVSHQLLHLLSGRCSTGTALNGTQTISETFIRKDGFISVCTIFFISPLRFKNRSKSHYGACPAFTKISNDIFMLILCCVPFYH